MIPRIDEAVLPISPALASGLRSLPRNQIWPDRARGPQPPAQLVHVPALADLFLGDERGAVRRRRVAPLLLDHLLGAVGLAHLPADVLVDGDDPEDGSSARSGCGRGLPRQLRGGRGVIRDLHVEGDVAGNLVLSVDHQPGLERLRVAKIERGRRRPEPRGKPRQ